MFSVSLDIVTEKKMVGFLKKAQKTMENFYGIIWDENPPQIYLVKTRKEYDALVGKKTERWQVGEAINYRTIVLISPDIYEKESIHSYSDEEYLWLMKHELSHLYYKIFSKGYGPVWMDEGFALFTSGEVEVQTKPKVFSKFLDHYFGGGKDIYKESGFVVKTLIGKYSKKQVLDFIQKFEKIDSEDAFMDLFEQHFGVKLGYSYINRMFK